MDKTDLDTTLQITPVIVRVRGKSVIIDRDLAKLYDVPTSALNQAVKRNPERFPIDFMFELNEDEKSELVTNCDRFSKLKHSTVNPYAFTEHGTIMAAALLNSPIAVSMSVYIVRAFVKLRELVEQNSELNAKFAKLERKVSMHDIDIKVLVASIADLMTKPLTQKQKIGFQAPKKL